MALPRNEAVTSIDAVLVNLALIARRLRKPDVVLTAKGARFLEEQINAARLAFLELVADDDAQLHSVSNALRDAVDQIDALEGRGKPPEDAPLRDEFPVAPAATLDLTPADNVVPFRRTAARHSGSGRPPFGRRGPGGAA